jgi:hypothetical protein
MILNFLILFAQIYIISTVLLFAIVYYIKNFQAEELSKAIDDKFPYPYHEAEDVIQSLNILPFIPLLNTLVIIAVIIMRVFKKNILKVD